MTMADRLKHRGKNPQDAKLFEYTAVSVLQQATHDFCWLLSRNYPSKASLKLIGDHYSLASRQRKAVESCSCSFHAAEIRKEKLIMPEQCRQETLWLDGYNFLITIESALAGGIILKGRDSSYRDMASVHGTYRKVEETIPALKIIGKIFEDLAVKEFIWYLDSPVSNSGRLKKIIENTAMEYSWNWKVILDNSPDKILAASEMIVVTSDSWILDRCRKWTNLTSLILNKYLNKVEIINLFDRE